MKKEYAIFILQSIDNYLKRQNDYSERDHDAIMMAIEALKEMPVEEYRQRLMEVFHNTDHDELLTYVVMPKEEEFKSLEDILRQYKYEPRLYGEWVSKPKRIQVDETDEERIFETRQEWFCSSCGKSCGLRKPEDAFCKYCGSDNRPKEGEKNEDN